MQCPEPRSLLTYYALFLSQSRKQVPEKNSARDSRINLRHITGQASRINEDSRLFRVFARHFQDLLHTVRNLEI
jgi:hypothetical protein